MPINPSKPIVPITPSINSDLALTRASLKPDPAEPPISMDDAFAAMGRQAHETRERLAKPFADGGVVQGPAEAHLRPWSQKDCRDPLQHVPLHFTHPRAKIPTRGDAGAAGYDLHAVGDDTITIHPRQRVFIDTGVALAIPPGYYGRVAPRSGLALKSGLDVLGDVIDSSYRDSIKVLLLNTGHEIVTIAIGDRCAQIIFERAYEFAFEEVDELPASERGTGGFGSTGV